MKKSVPFVAQNQRTDCGLACIAMILRFYKSYFSLNDLYELLEPGRDGVGLKQINQLLNKLNLDTKIYKIPTEKINLIPTPAILYWSKSHFVILERINKGSIFIIDPGYGKRKMTYKEFSENFSNFALYACPNKNFEKKSRNKNLLNGLDFLFANKWIFMKITLYALISYFLTIGIPIIIQTVIDCISKQSIDNNLINQYFLSLSLVFLVLNITNYFQDKNLCLLRISINTSLSHKTFFRLLNLPYKFFDNRNKSSILYTLNCIGWVKDIFADVIVQGIINIGSLIFILFYIRKNSVVLLLISLILISLDVVTVIAFSKFSLEKNLELLIEENKVQSAQNECINSMFDIKMSALEYYFKKDWEDKFNSYMNKNFLLERTNNKIKFLFSFLQGLSPCILLYVGILLMLSNKGLSLGTVIAIYSMSSSLFGTVSSLVNSFFKCQNLKLMLERLSDINQQPLEHNEHLPKLSIKGNVEFKNVSFSYTKNSELILKNLNFKICAGQKIGIVGKSGAGKSTLAKMIAGIYQPNTGVILFDDINFEYVDKNYIRKQMGIVSQESQLFNKSIYENIAMGKEHVNIDRVKEICKLVQIQDDIEKTPMGYNTFISEYGQNLSGGQCQRIVLARSIINKPRILILDEATSSLDSLNEKRISDLISETGCTRIVIAHRLSTIEDADFIIVLDKGKIIAQGSHRFLMKTCRLYYDMYKENNCFC